MSHAQSGSSCRDACPAGLDAFGRWMRRWDCRGGDERWRTGRHSWLHERWCEQVALRIRTPLADQTGRTFGTPEAGNGRKHERPATARRVSGRPSAAQLSKHRTLSLATQSEIDPDAAIPTGNEVLRKPDSLGAFRRFEGGLTNLLDGNAVSRANLALIRDDADHGAIVQLHGVGKSSAIALGSRRRLHP